MLKKILLAVFLIAIPAAYSSAAAPDVPVGYTPATTYTDDTPKQADDTFTTRIYEGSNVVCSSATNSCTFTSPGCGTGTHTYFGRTYSSKFDAESADSNSAVYTAPAWTDPVCLKTPKAPGQIHIGP